MPQITDDLSQRIEDCRELYLQYNGEQHELIEREMRERGHRDFHRRRLHRRFERGRCRPGWIETYGFDALLKKKLTAEAQRRGGNESDPMLMSNNDDQLQPQMTQITQIKKKNCFSLSASSASSAVKTAQHSSANSGTDFYEFQQWLKLVSPGMTWDWKHQVYIYKRLERVTKGECKRLMIFAPPRHGKSELVTVHYPAWRMKKDPSMKIIIGSYDQDLAKRFSRGIKRVLCEDHELSRGEEEKRSGGEEVLAADQPDDRGSGKNDRDLSLSAPIRENPRQNSSLSAHENASPFPFVRTRPKNTEAEWETTMGGGLRAVGVGSGVTGFGANLIIIDDPVKSRAEAESKTYRKRLHDWFNNDIYTRLEPGGAIILIQTRWHEDDLAGRLLRESQEEGAEKWEVVDL